MQRRGIHDLHRDQLLFRFRYLRSTGVPLHVPVERIRRYLVASTELLSRQTTRFKIADQLFSFAPATVPPKSCCTHSFRHASSSRPIPAHSRCTSPDAYTRSKSLPRLVAGSLKSNNLYGQQPPIATPINRHAWCRPRSSGKGKMSWIRLLVGGLCISTTTVMSPSL